MLIQTQNKNMLVNSDNLAYIHIDRIAQIRAVFATPGLASVCLGSYNSVEDCKSVISDILKTYEDESGYTYEMPQKDEVGYDWY